MSFYHVTASIVLYNSGTTVLKAIESFLNIKSLNTLLYLIDNSPTNCFETSNKTLLQNKNIKYVFSGKNLGYGTAHNIALKQSIEQSEFHLVLNPDVFFNTNVIEELYEYALADPAIGQIIPKVLYPDGKLQYVCKLIPTPLNLLSRLLPIQLFKSYNQKFELRFSGYNKIMEVPYLHGCFMFLKCSALKEIGVFDERFFMYPEDIDLTRRMYKKFKTIFYPYVSIVHEHKKASFKSMRMFIIHMQNIIKYFNKWGWFFDEERKRVNTLVLQQLTNKPL